MTENGTQTETVVDQGTDNRASVNAESAGSRNWISMLQINRFSGLYLWVILIIAFSLWIPDLFLSTATVQGIIMDQSITVILALGILIGLSAGQFDLAAAQTLGFSAVLVTWLIAAQGVSPFLASLICLAACVVIGLGNGLLVAWVGINSFIATLGTSSIILALTSLLSGDRYVGPVTDGFKQLSLTKLFGIPILLFYVLVIGIIVWYVLEHTPVGRRLAATGANPETARLVGVRTKKYIILCLVMSSFMAGIAGILVSARVGSVSASIGPAYLLPAFAGCFLGTTQLKPGRFNVWGTVLALFLLATGVKGFQLASGQNWITAMFNGLALIIAVGLAVYFERHRKQGDAPPPLDERKEEVQA